MASALSFFYISIYDLCIFPWSGFRSSTRVIEQYSFLLYCIFHWPQNQGLTAKTMERDRKNYRRVQPISICGDKLSYRKKKKPVTAINILVRFQVYSVSDARRRRQSRSTYRWLFTAYNTFLNTFLLCMLSLARTREDKIEQKLWKTLPSTYSVQRFI